MKKKNFLLTFFVVVILIFSFRPVAFAQVIDPYEISLNARKEAIAKNFARSEKIYKSILKNLDPKHKASLFGLAESKLWQEDFKEAKIYLNQYFEAYPNDPDGLRLKKQIQAAKLEKAKYKIRLSHYYEDVSFADNTFHPKIEFYYTQKNKWMIGGSFGYWDKFSTTFFDFGLSGAYWFGKNTILSIDANWAPDQLINPQQAYKVQVEQVVLQKFVPALSYKFADYQLADVHTINPGITWYFLPRFNWVLNYYFSLTNLSSADFINHAVMTKLNWNAIDPLTVFAGYSHTNEDFESGSPLNPFGSFSAHHVFAGGQYQFRNGLGVDVSANYETRSNDTSVLSVETGVFFKW